CKNRKIK
ncbi:unnamed protein product, partial [Diplocarpon coronariae]